jgi:hypothetical protein
MFRCYATLGENVPAYRKWRFRAKIAEIREKPLRPHGQNGTRNGGLSNHRMVRLHVIQLGKLPFYH